jgi:hypothetical protein
VPATDWFWEGNVVRAVARHLANNGWTIERLADTASREAGADIQAKKHDEILVVEVKGYPSKYYEHGSKKGKLKPTNPATQARHWFAEVLLTALLRQLNSKTQRVAIAFPDFDVYTNLLGQTRQALVKLDLIVFIVNQSGTVITV